MQTLFAQKQTLTEKIGALIGRHRLAFAMGVVVLALFAVIWEGYERLSYEQQPDPAFDARVAHPAYTTSHPRVLFDAGHVNVHTAETRYKPFADLIRNDGYEVVANRRRFTSDTLRGARVLVIANALGWRGVGAMLANRLGWHRALQWDFQAFTPEECDTVRDWVASGGSLLLISDHAPAGHAAQPLSLRFGVDMSNWFVEDEQHSDPDAYSFLIFSRQNGLLLPHPVTEGRGPEERVDTVVAFTGQSLRAGEGSTPFMKLADSAREYPTREAGFKEGRSAAGRAQGVALGFGKGRVVVLGEAAMLSAQVFRIPGRELRLGMEYPGCDNRKLALNIMHWLSGLLD